MSSYKGPFNELSPSEQADIRSFTEPERPIRMPSKYYPKGPSEVAALDDARVGQRKPKHKPGSSKGVRWWTREEDAILRAHVSRLQQALIKSGASGGCLRSPLQIAHRIGKLVYAQEHDLGPEGLDRLRP